MTKEHIKAALQSLGQSPTEQCFKDFLCELFTLTKIQLADTEVLSFLTHNPALSSFDFKQSIIYFTTTDTESKLQEAQSGHTNLAFSLIPTTSQHKTELVRATKAVNVAIPSYNILFFLSEDSLSIAFATRRLSRATNEKVDVLEKITLIKDISLCAPHPAHIDNLHSLSHLPIERTLDEYYQSLLEALSIESLNKAFFESIKTHFLDFCEQCTLPTDTQNQKDSINKKREFILRLLSRLLFCQFLEKKGLISPKLWDMTLSENYYHEVCEPLFFSTLNTPKEFRDYGLLESKITALLDAIPYLNGGLFAPREKEDFFEPTRPNAYINTLKIPNVCFEKLFKTFRSYHFTLSESTPLSQEVGLDPELLGMVFENLLSVLFTDNAKNDKDLRKATGSYYTPREIVSYMCASSLCESLKNRINMTESKLEKLVFEKDALGFTDTEAEEILKHLDSLKILDPACGSGAFPLGMLHEILEIQDALYESSALGEQCDKIYNFSQGTDAKSANLVKNRKNLHSPTANLGSLDSRGDLESVSSEEATLYQRKLRILQNNIYGIDIQPMATEIARLRCFLSLICDAPNDDIKPLPNLEFKFISANSLIPLPKQEGLGYVGYEEDMLKLKALREQTFDALNKQALESAYLALRDKIAKDISSAWQTHQVDFSKNPLLSWNPFDPHSVAEFFDSEWMFGIKVAKNARGGGALNDKDTQSAQGWDIVISNPPYIKEADNKILFENTKNLRTYQGKMDIWYHFVGLGFDIVKNQGIVTFIATNNWTTNAGAKNLRNVILTESQILNLIDFGSSMCFTSTSIQTMIMAFQKLDSIPESYTFTYAKIESKKPTDKHREAILKRESFEDNFYLEPTITPSQMQDKPLTFVDSKQEEVLNKILENGTFYLQENEAQIGIGLTDKVKKKMGLANYEAGTGIFQLSTKELKDLHLTKGELKLIKPLYTSNELFRFYANPKNSEWVIYTDSSFKNPNSMDKYPNLKKHLDKFRGVITSDNKPYGLHRAKQEHFFNKTPSIVSLRKCPNKPIFTYVDFDCYVTSTFFIIQTSRMDLKFLTGLLNSKLIAFWLRHKGKMQGNHYQIDKEPLMNIPLPKITKYNKPLCDKIITLVEEILVLGLKDSHCNTSHLESEIDKLVYKLYELNNDEIKTIEEIGQDRILEGRIGR